MVSEAVLLTLVGAVGWCVAKLWERRQATNSARRTELRAKIDATRQLVQSIEFAAHQYFQLAADDVEAMRLERQITTQLTTLANAAYDVDCTLPNANACLAHRAFKQAITLGDFQSVRRVARAARDPLLDDLTSKARALESRLEQAFRVEFGDDQRH